jgi:hypothetical protein
MRRDLLDLISDWRSIFHPPHHRKDDVLLEENRILLLKELLDLDND